MNGGAKTILYHDRESNQWIIATSMEDDKPKCVASKNTGFARANFPQDSSWPAGMKVTCCPRATSIPTLAPTASPTGGPTATNFPTRIPTARPSTATESEQKVIFYPPGIPKDAKGGLVTTCHHLTVRAIPPFQEPKCSGIYTMIGITGRHPEYTTDGFRLYWNGGWLIESTVGHHICLATRDPHDHNSPLEVTSWVFPDGNAAEMSLLCSKQRVTWFKPFAWPKAKGDFSTAPRQPFSTTAPPVPTPTTAPTVPPPAPV